MRRFCVVSLVALGVLVIVLSSMAVAMKPPARRADPPDQAIGSLPRYGPFVIVQAGDTAWVKVHTDSTYCPGDPAEGHGGEALGGPDAYETWCFENAVWPEDFNPAVNGELVTVPDSVGTNPPWDTRAFTHMDVRPYPSATGTNFWHLDTYMGVNGAEGYNDTVCLWCGSDSLWIDDQPVECDTWALDGNGHSLAPGYGNEWNCAVQLTLDGFTTTGTCTVAFDPRYDTECKYDYFYVEYLDTGGVWQELALFNGSSNTDQTWCGLNNQANPDYFGFGDTGQPNSADWVTRTEGGVPAFLETIAGAALPENPSFRWRFESDGAWADQDGRGNSDGAAMIDNVWIKVDGYSYVEDFEDNEWDTLAARGWTLPNASPVLDAWHQAHDPDPPYEGNDGQPKGTCRLDSSVVYRARPDQGYSAGEAWRNGWWYRLKSPKFEIPEGDSASGLVAQYDQFFCCKEITCDYRNEQVRFYSSAYGKWCPWIDMDGYIYYGGCDFWSRNVTTSLTPHYGPDADSMQFCWELLDTSSPGQACRGKHGGTDYIVDNVSFGFYDGTATTFSIREIDMLQDSFHDSLCAFNSLFGPSTYHTDSLVRYAGPPYDDIPIRKDEQLYINITDKNEINEIRLYGSIDEGQTWIYNGMTQHTKIDPANPDLGGAYYGNFCPTDFGHDRWPKATIWYYVWVEDKASPANIETWPSTANGGTTEDDFREFTILPKLSQDLENQRILLVDEFDYRSYDYAECMVSGNPRDLDDMYEEALDDLGYCYDKFDVTGAGSNAHVHPIEFGNFYDCVIWFTGRELSQYLFDVQAQTALKAYLNRGGKLMLVGEQMAYYFAPAGVGSDSLGGEFLNGIMGCEYIEEMEDGFTRPWVYLEAAPSVQVFGQTVPIDMDSLLIYRECTLLNSMSFVRTSSAPDTGYTAQPLLYVLDPPATADPADGAIYVEKPVEGGQCVFLNFSLGSFGTYQATECDGNSDLGSYNPGYYYGRRDILETVLGDIFGIFAPGGAGVRDRDNPPSAQFRWALGQNMPNPCVASTEIKFEVARTSDVSIKIYNAMGQLVKTLRNERIQPGRYSAHWDGTNASGEKVSSGVYFYKMEAGQFTATKKMLVVK